VTFPSSGTYELYARLRVGTADASDDSFFYGSGFGEKSPSAEADWITANNLNAVGQTLHTTIADVGTAGANIWKWVKLSSFNGGETPLNFTVSAGALTRTFQIGTREDGLRLDRLAFGRQGVTYTVGNLDSGTSATSVFVPQGPPMANGTGKFIGNVHSGSQVVNSTAYWNQTTPENAGKWGSVESTRDVMNWTQLDAAYQFAKTNGFPFRMHVLIWGSQQPTWIESLPPAEQLEEIEE
jgi:endo-1,4-beta-xylanase